MTSAEDDGKAAYDAESARLATLWDSLPEQSRRALWQAAEGDEFVVRALLSNYQDSRDEPDDGGTRPVGPSRKPGSDPAGMKPTPSSSHDPGIHRPKSGSDDLQSQDPNASPRPSPESDVDLEDTEQDRSGGRHRVTAQGMVVSVGNPVVESEPARILRAAVAADDSPFLPALESGMDEAAGFGLDALG